MYRCMCINLNTKAKASKGNDGVQMYVSELITAQSRSIHEMVLAPCVIPPRCACGGGGGGGVVVLFFDTVCYPSSYLNNL